MGLYPYLLIESIAPVYSIRTICLDELAKKYPEAYNNLEEHYKDKLEFWVEEGKSTGYSTLMCRFVIMVGACIIMMMIMMLLIVGGLMVNLRCDSSKV